MILPYFATSHTPLQKSLVYTVMPTSGDLKSGDLFFRPVPPPATEFADETPPPENFFFYLHPLPSPPPVLSNVARKTWIYLSGT